MLQHPPESLRRPFRSRYSNFIPWRAVGEVESNGDAAGAALFCSCDMFLRVGMVYLVPSRDGACAVAAFQTDARVVPHICIRCPQLVTAMVMPNCNLSSDASVGNLC